MVRLRSLGNFFTSSLLWHSNMISIVGHHCIMLHGIHSFRSEELFHRSNLLSTFSRHGHHRIVELLLRSKRFSVNAADNSHMTPLHLATLGGHVEVIRTLLDCPDINVVMFIRQGRNFFIDLVSLLPSMLRTKMAKQRWNSVSRILIEIGNYVQNLSRNSFRSQ